MVDTVIQYNDNHIECLDLHLWKITLNSYGATLPEIIFARFFVAKARVLKVMRLNMHLNRKYEWFVDQRWQLMQNGRGSKKAKRHIRSAYDRVTGSHCVKPIHDLSATDPFCRNDEVSKAALLFLFLVRTSLISMFSWSARAFAAEWAEFHF